LQLNPKDNNGNCPLIIGLVDTPLQPLGSNINAFLEPAIHVAGTPQLAPTDLTHGTAMVETVLDAVQAKTHGNTSVKILPVDVFGNNQSTTTFDVANGITQAVNNGATILNLSLGSTGNSQVLQNVISQATQDGIPVFAAAGNQPVTTPTYPAAYPGVIAVTASDPSGGIASYANRGSFVQMMAPGDNVVSFDGSYYQVEGTSTSTAIVSGEAAGLADAAGDCPSQAVSLLRQSSTPVPAPAH
jgi:thermitase